MKPPALRGPVTALPALRSVRAEAAIEDAVSYARGAAAPNTRAAYARDWGRFTAWAAGIGLPALPAAPETIGAYLAAHARTHAMATLRRWLASISQAHRAAGQVMWSGHPAIRTTLRGITRAHGRPQRQSAAITTAEIRKLVAVCGSDLTGQRDRAMLLLGFAGALRRSEIVAVEREHLVFDGTGVRLTLLRSKSDQAGEGRTLGIPRGQHAATCPVRALEAWLTGSDCRYGPVFRGVNRWGHVDTRALHPTAVGLILRRRAEAAGVTGSVDEPISPHGLRAGFVTEAYRAGLRDEEIMGHSRHTDLKTMRRYVRRAKLMLDSPATKLGL
jgi:integrase